MRTKKILEIIIMVCFTVLWFPTTSLAESAVSIENTTAYKGMKQSFSKGYEPEINKNQMKLVVPFIANEAMEQNKIVVSVEFDQTKESPFYFKNYQKEIKRSKGNIYLYNCSLQLKQNRKNGQYPLYLRVTGKTKNNQELSEIFTIYVEITDGTAEIKSELQDFPEEDNMHQTGQQSEAEKNVEESMAEGITVPKTQVTEEPVSHQPRILLDTGELKNKILEPGAETVSSITAKNCSASMAMENVKITVTSENTSILFEKSSWYFNTISPGDFVLLESQILLDKKAMGSIPVQVQLEYDDKKGNSYTTTETIALSVTSPPKVSLSNVSFPNKVYATDTNSLTLQVQNAGLTSVYNAKIIFEGNGLFSVKELFLGTIEAGAATDGEIPVYAGNLNMKEEGLEDQQTEEYGKTTGKLTFTYEDESGEIHLEEMEVNTEIVKPVNLSLQVEEKEPETNQWWITIFICIGLVLLLGIIWIYQRMQYYKKRVKIHETP